MDWKDLYRQKLVTAEAAAKVIKSDDRIWYSPTGSAPVDLINAISKRKDELQNVNMYSGLILYPFDYFKGEFKGHIKHNTFFMGPIERTMFSQGNMEVISYHFSQTDWLVRNVIKPNVFLTEVSPPDEKGDMSFGVMGNFAGHIVASMADTIIVQVNNEAPYVCGDRNAFINVKDVTYICEGDHKLPELPSIPITEIEKKIASHIVPYIEDGSTIQIGIGGLGNAVGFFLENHKDLGVHTEMAVDSMAALAEKGVVNGSKKTLHPGEFTCSFGIGSRKLYDFMHRNKALRAYPVSYINDETVIGQNNKVVAINNALMCDLTGQVCSESLGFQQFSGTGGQLNFVRGAMLSPGGKAFLALDATTKKQDGTIVSRITSSFLPGSVVTTPRSDVQYIVTEYGAAYLRGKNISERAREMIKIAHPMFREQLEKEARENRILM
jgi:4-hydroxybutyrate CoA-transferase